MSIRLAAPGLALVLAAACSGAPPTVPDAAAATAPPSRAGPPAPFHRAVSTSSPQAQLDFDCGLLLCYGFNHEAAILAFDRAAAADPRCAMAHWGHALALGPNINHPGMDETATRAAVAEVEKARALASGASPVEQALIAALATRYEVPPPADRAVQDAVYADAMRTVRLAHPDDPDVATLFGEALLDLRPWNQWRADGQPEPGTLEAVGAFDAVLALHPDHPGANHFEIHALEASPHPEKALPSADRLRTLVAGSGHLLHMPAHIDMELGHYGNAVAANLRAIAADDRELGELQNAGAYASYRAHNRRHLAWAAMYDGQKRVALEAAREQVRRVTAMQPPRPPQSVEASLALPWHVLIRFGEWEAILAEPAPAPEQRALKAFWLEARALSFSALRRRDEADAARADFEDAVGAVPADYRLGKNSVHDLLEVARALTEGELDYRHGRFDHAFTLLRDAVAKEDALHFDEPADWMVPVRHALGALLLEQGRLDEAQAVYRDDLRRHPENGWSLHGLGECLRRGGSTAEADEVDARFKAAWARADVVLPGSCYCRIGDAQHEGNRR